MVYQFLKKIGLHSVIYGIGNISYAIPGFLLIPLYTRRLTPEDYGAFSLLAALFGILLYFYEMGMVGALNRQFFSYTEADKKRRVTSTAFFFILAYGFILTALLIFARRPISNLFFRNNLFGGVIAVGLASGFFQAAIFIPQTVIRLKEKSVLYVALILFQISMLIASTVLFLLFLNRGLIGVYEAFLLTYAATFIAYLAFTVRDFAFTFSIREFRHLAYLGLAFFPALLLTWVIESSDRYILNMFLDLKSVGVYSLGYKIGQVSMLIVKSFYFAWTPIIFSIVKLDDAPRIFGRLATYFLAGISIFAVAISIYSKEILGILATREYLEAHKVIFIVSLSYLFYGLYVYFITGIIIKKNVYSIPLVLLAGALVNISLNLFLIPRLGITGSALATLGSYASIALATYYFSQSAYHIFYELKKISAVILSGIGVYFFSRIIRTENLYLAITGKTVILGLYVLLLYLLGIITKGDILKIKEKLAKAVYA